MSEKYRIELPEGLIIDSAIITKITDDTDTDSDSDPDTEYPNDGDCNWEIGNEGNIYFPHRRARDGVKLLTVDMDTDRIRTNWKDQVITLTLYQTFAALQVKLVLFNPTAASLTKNQTINDDIIGVADVTAFNLIDTNGNSQFSSIGSYSFDIQYNVEYRNLTMGTCFEYSADYPRDCIVVTKAGDFSKNKSGYIRLLSGIDGDWINR